MKIENKQIAIAKEEVVVNMRMEKGFYEHWKWASEMSGIGMVDLLDILVSCRPKPKEWPWKFLGKR